jgi:hypothetical protein
VPRGPGDSQPHINLRIIAAYLEFLNTVARWRNTFFSLCFGFCFRYEQGVKPYRTAGPLLQLQTDLQVCRAVLHSPFAGNRVFMAGSKHTVLSATLRGSIFGLPVSTMKTTDTKSLVSCSYLKNHQYLTLRIGNIDITTTLSYDWDGNIPTAALSANGYWVFRFTPFGATEPFLKQISSSGLLIAGTPQPSTVVNTVTAQPSSRS